MRYTDDGALPVVTDDMLKQSLGRTLPYTVVILKAGPNFSAAGPDRDPAVAATIWEHGKRNFALREAGLLAVVPWPTGRRSPELGSSPRRRRTWT